MRDLFLTISIPFVALIGDYSLSNTSFYWYKAIVDSSTHFTIALLSWLVLNTKLKLFDKRLDLIITSSIGTLIDLDHFIEAGSTSLKDALHLGDIRPILHCIEDMFNDDEEEVVTAKAVFEVITQAWINEKLCPELLPHKADYVEVMTEQIEQMEENVRQLDQTDLRSLIHRQELERIRFLLRSYLRTRLSKIEHNSIWLFKNPESLSDEEREFLKEYITISVEPLKLLCDRMPGPIGTLNPNQIEIQPDLDTHVFVKSIQDIDGSIIIPDPIREDEVNIKKGSQHIIPYSCIREQMANRSLKPVPYMLSISSLSHHIRDATRRGLWFWPFGSTRPIPYPIYLFLLGLLPNLLKWSLNPYKTKNYVIVM